MEYLQQNKKNIQIITIGKKALIYKENNQLHYNNEHYNQRSIITKKINKLKKRIQII